MKLSKPIILVPLFCIMLCMCAGMGHIFSLPDGKGFFAEFQKQADQVQTGVKTGNSFRWRCTDVECGTLDDPVAGYIRTVRSSSFMAAHNTNCVAERTPVQYLRTGQSAGAQNGHWFSFKRRNIQKTVCSSGVKASIFGASGLVVPYHKTVSVLNCDHFSKCYILALGRLLC